MSDTIREYLFTKHRTLVYELPNLKALAAIHPMYERYSGGWMEKDFEAIKVRKDVDPEHYTARNLQLPNALKLSDLFNSVRLTSGNAARGEYFLGTRCNSGLKDGWQGSKFMKFYVTPTQELKGRQKEVMGYDFSAFELIQWDDNRWLVTCKNATPIGSMDGMWASVVYDIPEIMKVSKES